MLYPMVESSLPEEVLRAWKRNPTAIPAEGEPAKTKLDQLMAFLRREEDSEQSIALARGFDLVPKEKKMKERSLQAGTSEDYATAAGLFVGSSEGGCVFCGRPNHQIADCFSAKKMSVVDKRERLRQKKRCFSCFGAGHVSTKCKSAVKCSICGGQHHVLLCNSTSSGSREESSTTGVSAVNYNSTSGGVLLKTELVKLVGEDGDRVVRVVYDDGSQHSYVRSSTAEVLNCCKIGEVSKRKALFGGTITSVKRHKKFQVELRSLDGRVRKSWTVLDEEKICGKIPRVPDGPWMNELFKRNIVISDTVSNCCPEEEIQILIGSDYWSNFITGKKVRLQCGLTAWQTIFGWTLSGAFQNEEEGSCAMVATCLLTNSFQPEDLWSLELLGIRDPIEKLTVSKRENAVKKFFQETVTRDKEGRYCVRLPWVDDEQRIPNNKTMAVRHLLGATVKLNAANKFQTYDDIFTAWVKEGIIEEVNDVDKGNSHYLPHRAVYKPQSLTTPVRPVFNASWKTGRAPSLNDSLEKGPNLLELIPAVLLRFRMRKYGVISDIRKAFQMIDLDEADRDYLRFLWWKDYEKKELVVFRHKRVVFGINCSPYLLAAVLEHHLKRITDERRRIAITLLNSIYVDNSITSLDTEEEYLEFRRVSTELIAEMKMELRCWEYGPMKEIPAGEKETTNVLGLIWNKKIDDLGCEVSPTDLPEKITKRTMLSSVQKIFDSMGFLAPALLIPKLLLQKEWRNKSTWDEELIGDSRKEFLEWWEESSVLGQVRVPRDFANGWKLEDCQLEFHVFSDASKFAYAGMVFVRVEKNKEVFVQLLQCKTRVAPLKVATIPRLELMGCVIATRLAKSVKESLGFEDAVTHYWSDSTTAISWIQRNDDWGTFVGNRVKEICSLTKVEEWKHVPGLMNPADLPSRGCRPSELVESRWWEGPAWLKDRREWPEGDVVIADEDEVLKERKKSSSATMLSTDEDWWYCRRFEDFDKNVRVLGYCLRWYNNYRLDNEQRPIVKLLSVKEIAEAEELLCLLVQKEVFKKSEVQNTGLSAFKDGKGLWRIRTKLLQRKDSAAFRNPILLPKEHPAVEQLIRQEHLRSGHGGIQFLMGLLRERYWIIQCRSAVRKVVGRCVRCTRFAAKAPVVQDSTLPEFRVNDVAVFQICGVDIAGPLFLKDKRKVWIALFTCAVYRGVHVEIVESLSTESFLMALHRFIARRGRPTTLVSDNGRNFVGAANLFEEMDWKKLGTELSLLKIGWKFNPPAAPWWGGFWERLIRSVKDQLKRILGRQKLSYVELETCLCEVESVINDRPLTYVREDSNDLIPLTPSLFLKDLKRSEFPEMQNVDGEELRKKYRNLGQLHEELRHRFRKEYLSLLVQRSKKEREEFHKDDVVLVGADGIKRQDWPMGRIMELLPGKDGKIRLVRLKTATGEILRPVQRLYNMEVSSNESSVGEFKKPTK